MKRKSGRALKVKDTSQVSADSDSEILQNLSEKNYDTPNVNKEEQ